MIEILQVLLCFSLLTGGLCSSNNDQTEAELIKSKTNVEFVCFEDGVFCSDINEYRCSDGLLGEPQSCSDGHVCVNSVGCISREYLHDLSYLPHGFGNGVESKAICEDGDVECSGKYLIFCREDGTYIFDCTDAGLDTCEDGMCVMLPTTTAVPCTDLERRCKETSIEICVGNQWTLLSDCSTTGHICLVDNCVQPLCTEGNKNCNESTAFTCVNGLWIEARNCSETGMTCAGGECVPTNCGGGSVLSTHPNIQVPNLEDSTCGSYYECQEPVSPNTYNCLSKICPLGQRFDSCTGYCSTSALCNWPSPCITTICQSTNSGVLGLNNKLAHNCSVEGNTVNTLWSACPEGYFNAVTLACTTATTSCYNGGQNNGTCTAAGIIPLPGTNCGYRKCYPDLTSHDVPCANNYYFDISAQKCMPGQCS